VTGASGAGSVWSKDASVLHGRFGQGTVILEGAETTVVRFGHGIEEVLSADLEALVSVAEAVSGGTLAPSLEVGLRVQGEVITAVNEAWGVFSRSRITLLPHQLWVCHRALRAWPIRLLIADDVGMGKTIEAGLLLWPLLASRKVQRLLVLCPAKLVGQWQMRLKRMFDIRAAVYHSDLDTQRGDFWGIHPIVIASLPTLRLDRKGRQTRLLDAPDWDMVVVDEAHHLHADADSGKTLGFELIERLNQAGKIASCVFFTGTPHRGKSDAFWSLMGLLDADVFSPRHNEAAMLAALPRYLIRNAKQKVTNMKGELLFKPVIQHPETFRYSPAEERFYRLLSEFILAGKAYATSLGQRERGQIVLVLIALQKLASSSIAAVAAALRTRVSRLSAEAASWRRELEGHDDTDGTDTDQALLRWLAQERTARLQLMQDEERHLSELLDAASRVTAETRIVRIIAIVKARFPDESVLLFTEYKRTQALVVSALMAEFGEGCVGFINGDDRLEGVCQPDGRVRQLAARREDTCDAFNAGRLRFLVSTEAGGEGIDLQERCSALIHVDFPWNPMRLHQRVGRLNRYGQRRAVHVVSLRNPDTVEGMIWERLEQKLNRIMRALGSAMDEPEDLMQLVLGMTRATLFDELYAEAPEVPREKLAAWVDTKTGTLGGESAIKTVRELVGHAQSFDLSDLKDVPPVDLPDLMPYFRNALALNRRRPKVDGHALSFRTPEAWLTTHALRKHYEDLVFDRGAPNMADLIGVGHPLLEKALHQSARLPGRVCVLDGMATPLMVFEIASRVTDVAPSARRAIVGVSGWEGAFRLLRDWEILRLLNQSVLRAEPHAERVDAEALARWRRAATGVLDERLDTLDLQFRSPLIQESALFWPVTSDR